MDVKYEVREWSFLVCFMFFFSFPESSITLQKLAKPNKIHFYLVNFPSIIFEIFFFISKWMVRLLLLIYYSCFVY